MTTEKENLIKENSTINEELVSSKEKLAAFLEEKKQFEDGKSLFEKEIEELKETLLIEKQHINEKDTELQSIKKTKEELSNEFNHINSSYVDVKSDLENQRVENESLRKQIDSLISEKEELSPYMYLIEAKKEEEAKELAIKQSKEELSELINTATTLLLGIIFEKYEKAFKPFTPSPKTILPSSFCQVTACLAS